MYPPRNCNIIVPHGLDLIPVHNAAESLQYVGPVFPLSTLILSTGTANMPAYSPGHGISTYRAPSEHTKCLHTHVPIPVCPCQCPPNRGSPLTCLIPGVRLGLPIPPTSTKTSGRPPHSFHHAPGGDTPPRPHGSTVACTLPLQRFRRALPPRAPPCRPGSWPIVCNTHSRPKSQPILVGIPPSQPKGSLPGLQVLST